MKRRIGRFSISHELLKNWKQLIPLFAQLVVVRCESHFDTNTIEYTAFSDLFDELAPGEKPPHYSFEFFKDPKGVISISKTTKTGL